MHLECALQMAFAAKSYADARLVTRGRQTWLPFHLQEIDLRLRSRAGKAIWAWRAASVPNFAQIDQARLT